MDRRRPRTRGRRATIEPTYAAGTPSLLRAINERSALEAIRRSGPVSRAEVARQTGLSKPTVSLALAELTRAGLVREVGRTSGGKGPSAILYELNPQAGWVVGIDVGREYVRAAIADITGAIVARRDERARVRSAASLIDQIGEIAHSLAGEAGLRWRQVTQAAIGSPGVLDPERGAVALAANLPGWGRQGLVEALRKELGTNLTFENDVNLAAIGEGARGHGRDVDSFVYLWVGTGVGMGLVLNGELYRGTHGAAGEIAYLPVGPGDPKDPVNRRRGTFEEAAAAAGIVRAAQGLGMQTPLTPKKVFAAARRGHPAAMEAVEIEAARLALGIAAIAPVVDPALVILGGGVGHNGDLLLGPIERELAAISPFHPPVVVSALGEEAVLHGAVATALDAARDRLFARTQTA